MSLLTLGEALAEAAQILRRSGCEAARLDAEVLLAFVLGVSRTDLYIQSKNDISEDSHKLFLELVERRASREPVAYLTGEREFMSLDFYVDRNVLIPRPETEIIVEEALEIKPLCAVDVGTGSGAIAVALAFYLSACRVYATDISPAALRVARKNAERHGVAARLDFVEGNLLDPLADRGLNGRVDLITANLPYIPAGEMDGLPADVRAYEPHLALEGGFDGLDYYRRLCPDAFRLLREGGVLLLEMGCDQGRDLEALLKGNGFPEVRVIKDLAGLDRVVKAVR